MIYGIRKGENIMMNDQTTMTPLEKTEFKNVVKAFDEEELQIAVRSLPNEVLIQELQRRITTAASMLSSISTILKGKEQEVIL